MSAPAERPERLLKVLFPDGRGLIVLIEGYFDESGDFEQEPKIFCLSGYFITVELAEAMDAEWGRVLDEYGLPYFHTVDCAHGKPHETKRDELDLLPREEGMKRADDLLRAMLNSPPDPQTPKPKPKRRKRA